METRLITFRKLQELCESKYWWNFEPRLSCQHDDIYEDNTTIDCCSKNCPVWKKLKVIERQ
jgi:hypothetical protein